MGSKTSLRYHIILTTKYRKPCLTGIEQQVYQALRQVEANSSFRVLAMGIEDGNHIHLAIKTSPKYSIASLVNRIKGMTQKILWETNPNHLSRYYWGAKRKLWHGAYYASTTGNISTQQVLNYVQNQNGPPEQTPTTIHRRG